MITRIPVSQNHSAGLMASRILLPFLVLSSLTTSTGALSSNQPPKTLPAAFSESALQQVQWLGSRIATTETKKAKVQGLGGAVISNTNAELSTFVPKNADGTVDMSPAKEKQVWEALVTLEQDMQLLDRLAGQKPQLSILEFTLLASAVTAAAVSPLIGHLANVVAPSSAAFVAALGISAEYSGKVAVADGKEIAAASIQCAAEAEGLLAQAERAKAVTPLCVGISATSATLALLVPRVVETLGLREGVLVTELYLLCPLLGVLCAAVASLAYQETRAFTQRAIGVGTRRFAKKGLIGRTWLSSPEMVLKKSEGLNEKWKNFAVATLPAPLLGASIPGALSTKAIVAAALAAAQAAYYLAQAESDLGRATDAVALKARSAAVCDTYANQGARSSAILPFTSALGGLCAAATAAVVELPFVESLAASGTAVGTLGQMVAVTAFPFLSSLFAAAATVSKARCEVDAEAATQAASTIALPFENEDDDPVLRPIKGVFELIRLTFVTSVRKPLASFWQRISPLRRIRQLRERIQRRQSQKPGMQSP